MNTPELSVGIFGATGLVGGVMLEQLEKREFPMAGEPLVFASERSAGTRLPWKDGVVVVEDMVKADVTRVDIALFSAPTKVSRKFAPSLAILGATVIDNSSAFRMNSDIPLVVSEVNPGALDSIPNGIVANPNCTTMVGMVALNPLHDFARLNKLVVSTYQAVSGAGQKGIDEFRNQHGDSRSPETPVKFPHRILGNVIPFAGTLQDDGETDEEKKLRNESRKILDIPRLKVSPTCARVPVENVHCLAMVAHFDKEISPDQATNLLSDAPGVDLSSAPMPLYADGKENVLVGRIRADLGEDDGKSLALWVAGDNLLKGAALNAVQIAELIAQKEPNSSQL